RRHGGVFALSDEAREAMARPRFTFHFEGDGLAARIERPFHAGAHLSLAGIFELELFEARVTTDAPVIIVEHGAELSLPHPADGDDRDLQRDSFSGGTGSGTGTRAASIQSDSRS